MNKCKIKHKSDRNEYRLSGDKSKEVAQEIFDVLDADAVLYQYHILYGPDKAIDIDISEVKRGAKQRHQLSEKHLKTIRSKIEQKNFAIEEGDQDE